MHAALDTYGGPAAGIATSIFWTIGALVFTAAIRRIGPTLANALRIGLTVLLLSATHRLLAGAWIPSAEPGQVAFLALSGIVGLCIGDQALFISFVDIGPRLAMLIMTTSPILAALFGWLALGETLGPVALLGVTLTVVGVGWVVLERPDGATPARTPRRLRGMILAFIAAACQAGGLLLSKQGIGHGWLEQDQHMTAQAATLIRMSFAGLGMLPILALHGYRRRGRTTRGVRSTSVGSRRAGFMLAASGAVLSSYLGVWLSLVATDRAPVGIAQTLCSLSPIFLLPFAKFVHRERISPRAVVGAIIAVGGSALLFVGPR